jgi:methionine sulfoxide reductase heme-binding subunit
LEGKMKALAIWNDHAGRFSALKAATLLLVLLPGATIAFNWWTGALGGRPITEAIHGMGDWAARLLVITLAVTPARALFDWPRVVLLRRMIGVATACYAGTHLLLYCLDNKWNLLVVASEIVLRFYLTIGFVTLTGLMVLAFTSTDGWQKHLGRNWKRLHKIVFALAVLALFHYFLQSKAAVTNAVFLAGLFFWLGLWRMLPRRWQTKLWPLPVLSLAAALLTAAVEASWYGLATRVDVQRVLLANLDIAFGLRPSAEVLLAGLAVFAVAALCRLLRRRRPSVAPVGGRAAGTARG